MSSFSVGCVPSSHRRSWLSTIFISRVALSSFSPFANVRVPPPFHQPFTQDRQANGSLPPLISPALNMPREG